jgi:hypothetical protein
MHLLLYSVHVVWLTAILLAATVAGQAQSSRPSVAASSNVPPTLALAREGAIFRIEFTGTLQTAPNILGPWTDLTHAVASHPLPGTGPSAFFRSRATVGIFDRTDVADMTLTGPWQQHFDLALAGSPDGIFPPVRPKPYFSATLTYDGRTLPISARVRGNSSLQECPFPKLKFKVARADRTDTAFADAREVKIGTHCAEGGRGNIGRLRNEIATFREALAYEAMATLGLVTPRIRRARLDYIDTTPASTAGPTGWRQTRQGLLLDDIEVVAERLSGRVLSDEELAGLTHSQFDELQVLELRLFQALLGNWDYDLGIPGPGLRNMEVIALPNNTLLPVAGDFDLSSWVTEVVRPSVPNDVYPELPLLERQMHYELDQIRAQTKAEVFLQGRARFAQERVQLEALVAHALVDSAGRTNAAAHVRVFYEAMDSRPR